MATKPNEYDIGDVVVIDATFTVGVTPTNPDLLECKIKKPDKSVETVVLTEQSTGVFQGTYSPATSGTYVYRVTGMGAAAASEEKKFKVRTRQVPDA